MAQTGVKVCTANTSNILLHIYYRLKMLFPICTISNFHTNANLASSRSSATTGTSSWRRHRSRWRKGRQFPLDFSRPTWWAISWLWGAVFLQFFKMVATFHTRILNNWHCHSSIYVIYILLNIILCAYGSVNIILLTHCNELKCCYY